MRNSPPVSSATPPSASPVPHELGLSSGKSSSSSVVQPSGTPAEACSETLEAGDIKSATGAESSDGMAFLLSSAIGLVDCALGTAFGESTSTPAPTAGATGAGVDWTPQPVSSAS